ncbi:hypothetical protein DPEC_G00249630 [Dallia pectoralis]|uniref:Uncharacterized protein n=1 Tax=Dallia pectoralis TaxID=75939 RepID=A0ACC2FSV7_DALPE|nr:hypothetical protein DPEC_G00249630 [Dallia pectoralis]
MKNLTALLLISLLCSCHMTSADIPQSLLFLTAGKCCTKFTIHKIPAKQVASYRRTSSRCPRTAVIFTTNMGREFCVDPSQAWVKSHMDIVSRRPTL